MDKDDIKKRYDLNEDGIIEDEEIDKIHKMNTFKNRDEKSDAQKRMAWYSLFGMILYPLLVVITGYIGLETVSNTLGNMAATYFGSVALIVAAFFGTEAYKSKSDDF